MSGRASASRPNFNLPPASNSGSFSSSSDGEEEYFRVIQRQRSDTDAELLDVHEGQIIRILRANFLGMVYGECLQTSQRGHIQRSNLTAASAMDLIPWYIGKCSREEAEQIFQTRPVTRKTFLIRRSETMACYILCMAGGKAIDTIRHRKIIFAEDKYYAWSGYNFGTVTELVKYHMTATEELNIGAPYNKFLNAASCPVATSAAPSRSNSLRAGLSSLLQHPRKQLPKPANVKPVRQNSVLDEWYIGRNEIQPGRILGTGCFGEVRMATLRNKGLQLAMKTFKSSTMNAESFKNEALVMKDLRHPYLVKLFGMSDMNDSRRKPFILMEYHALGSIKDYCETPGLQPLSLPQKAVIAKNVVSGMEYLSNMNYIHRDLAARNVLLTSDLTAKVADFGLAKCMTNSSTSDLDVRMPWKWSAPEVIGLNPPQWSTKCDVWSYGIFCWELYSNCKRPYETIWTVLGLLEYLGTGRRLELSAARGVPVIMRRIMKECWTMSADDRTNFSKIQQDLQIYS